jgi:hypothetical protein
MSFSVEWLPPAERQLARLWVDHPNQRNAVTAAVAAIDVMLGRDPSSFGESRSGNERVGFEGPLAISFLVFESRREAQVRAVWLTR